MPSTRKAQVVSLLIFLVGCGASETPSGGTPSGGTSPSTRETEIAPTAPPEPPASTASSRGADPYEVHEWGVIDVQEDGNAEIAAGAGRPGLLAPSTRPPSPVRKPVLYFHLGEHTESLVVHVSARLVGGTIYETFPVASLVSSDASGLSSDTFDAPDTAHWTGTLHREHCNTHPVVARDLPECATPDGICEVRELPRYDASTASCIEVEGVRAGMLFYRGMATPNLPLRIERHPDLSLDVTTLRPIAGTPGMVMRISTAMSGPWPVGHVVISRVAIPEVGTTASLPVGSVAVDRTATRAELDAALTSLGLDGAERDAFLGEWMTSFFGPEPGASGRASDGSPPMPQDSVLYFLSEAAVEDVAVLTFSPAPHAVRRAFMVRVILPGITTA